MVPVAGPHSEDKVMVEEVKSKTPMEIAEAEVEAERNKEAVRALKEKLHQRADAEKILANINREIEDLNARITDGTYDIG